MSNVESQNPLTGQREAAAIPAVPENADAAPGQAIQISASLDSGNPAGRQEFEATVETERPRPTTEAQPATTLEAIQERNYQGGNLSQNRNDIISRASAAGRGFSHQPNVLDTFANYTYHIAWSLTDDIGGSRVQAANDFRNITKVVIAESGVTAGFNIIDFEIENLCAPDNRVRSMLHTTFKMTIKEPYGLSLIDRIYSLSRRMGVKNHLTNSTFIEIWFTGYNEDGSIATPEMRSSIYKLFRVNITKMESDTKSEGTEYKIEGIIDGSYANADHIAVAPNGANVGPVSDVGQFFDALARILNEQQSSLQYDFNRRVEYEFQVPTWMRSWKFSRSPTTSRRNDSISVQNPANITNPTFSIARGMDVNTILYFVISATEEGQNYVAGENQPASRAGVQGGRSQASISANGMANIFAIHSRSQLIGFDWVTNDYIRKITYTFTEYPTTRAMIDQTNVQASLQPSQQRNRYNTLARSRRYNKIYEYIFSGRNLDVLKMEIKLEWFWQATIPTHLGENVYSNWSVGSRQDPNSVANDIINEYRSARQARTRAQAQVERLEATSRSGGSDAERERARQELEIARASLRQAEAPFQSGGQFFGQNSARRFQEIWGDTGPGQQAINNIQASRDLLNIPRIAATISSRNQWSDAVRGRETLYLEDIKVIDINTNPLPISFRTNPGPVQQATNTGGAAPVDRASSGQGVGTLPRNQSLVSAVLNDVMSTPYFAQVELEIRGDPYWMGLGNVEENRFIGGNNNQQPPPQNSAWFYGGETGFFLTFRTGESPSENTGYIEFNNTSIAFTGVYSCISVRSFFKNGQFTQVLKAIRDNLTLPQTPSGAPSSAVPVAGVNTAPPAGGGVGATPATAATAAQITAESQQQASEIQAAIDNGLG